MLLDEVTMTLGRVGAAAKHDGIELREAPDSGSEVTGLCRATGGVVLGIEVENDPLSLVVDKPNGIVSLVRQRKRGGLLSNSNHGDRFYTSTRIEALPSVDMSTAPMTAACG